ncbi:Nitrogenase iron protein [Sporomusa acidovorans DSM 3132]|uniref:nitrogenase n=1 Tax=Sporomusa acidovorans (strain ATCC 49682 / DSM 3132 / Mol) TaxID=1123286 RepID=A0ABZ3IZ18_SPOA4|nr:nitrogenase iron protein 1 [Sporomusa acidovorans DSM 3132]SDF15172.1 4Fe-4S iron sulfur cluster binding protein, NifH/frxC family [Sporomusa acidovorans]
MLFLKALLKVYDELELDVVIYDVLGDVVCGGFAVPIRKGIAEHVFTVSLADFMAIYAANNLFKGIKKYSNSGGALLGGLIANSINAPYAKEIVDDFVKRDKILEALQDCQAILTMRIGYHAKEQLGRKGIFISEYCDTVESGLRYTVNQMTKLPRRQISV